MRFWKISEILNFKDINIIKVQLEEREYKKFMSFLGIFQMKKYEKT